MSSFRIRLIVLAAIVLGAVAFFGTGRTEAGSSGAFQYHGVSGMDGTSQDRLYAFRWGGQSQQQGSGRLPSTGGSGRLPSTDRYVPPTQKPTINHKEFIQYKYDPQGGRIRRPSPVVQPPPSVDERLQPQIQVEQPKRRKPVIIITPRTPLYDQGGYGPAPVEVKDDTEEEEKPKPKKRAAPVDSAPKPKPRTVKIEAKPAEDKGGSVAARRFLITNAIGFPVSVAAQIWADPLNSEKKALEALIQAREGKKFLPEKSSLMGGSGAGAQGGTIRHSFRELTALRDLATVYYWLGLFSQASQHLRTALIISQEDFPAESESVMLSIGGLNAAAGEYNKAADSFDQALASAGRSGDRDVVSTAHVGRALISKKNGQLKEALHELKLAWEQASDSKTKARALSETGDTFLRFQQYSLAEETLKKALAEAEKAGDAEREQEIQLRLAELYRAWGKPDEARRQLLPAVIFPQKTGGLGPYMKKFLADMYMASGELHKAESWAEESGDLSSLGRLELLQGNYKKAAQHYEQLSQQARKSERLEDLFAAYTGLGRAAEAAGNKGQAEQYYTKAMEAADKMRDGLLLSERIFFFSVPCEGFKPSEPAKGLTRVQLQTKGKAAGVLPSEMIRARYFADKIVLASKAPGSDVPAHVVEKEKALIEKLASAQKRKAILTKEAHPERYTKIAKEINGLEKELKEFIATVSSKYSSYAAARFPKPVDVSRAALKADEHVVFLDSLGQGVGVRLIKGNKVVAATYVPWPEEEMNKDIESFRDIFKLNPNHKLRRFDEDHARRLYDKLLATVLDTLPAGTRLTIIPDENLALIPFEALVVGAPVDKGSNRERPEESQFLGYKYPVSYYPSLTALTFARRLARERPSEDRFLVIADPVFDLSDPRAQQASPSAPNGDEKESYARLMVAIEEGSGGKTPPLHYTAKLASGLREMCPDHCDVLEGFDATKVCFLDKYALKLDRYRWIVFATHGFLSDQIPGIREPGLLLTRLPYGTDGFLKMSEIAGLKVDADLVALIACQTGGGAVLTGEGVQGMGRAFQCAGAKSVLMSLWSVDEKASVDLAEAVFKHLRSGKSKREAFQQAKRELREAGKDHPFYWAAFILVGEAD